LCGFAAVAWLAAGGALGQTETAEAAGQPLSVYAQSWLGAVDTDRSWTLEDQQADSRLEGDVGTLPYIGGAGSRMWGERLRYGFEGGGLLSWKSDSVRLSSIGGGLRVEIENQLLSFEVFMGGLLSIEPVPGLRLYLAAGPSLAWARVKNDDDEAEVLPSAAGGSTIVIDLNSREDDFSAALYGRAGLEFEFANGFTLGASARYIEHNFDFGSSGELKLDEVQWFLTLGSRI